MKLQIKIVLSLLTVLLCSYSWFQYKLTEDRLNRCKLIRTLLIKHYHEIPKEKSDYESIILSRFLLNKFDSITDPTDRKLLLDFFKDKEIDNVYLRDIYCIRFEFTRNDPFLFWWKAYYLVYHTANDTRYGCQDSDPQKCRLFPWGCEGCEKVIATRRIDDQWIFVTTKGHASGFH